MRHRRPTALAVSAALALALTPTLAPAGPAQAGPTTPSVAVGYGGAISTVDRTATAVGLDVLRRGGNAADAAIAAAATLGVTEPFSAGIGGGGFFVHYDAGTRRVETIDGRETAPSTAGTGLFLDPQTGLPYTFDEARVSGLSVGVPGTLHTWRAALAKWGSRSLASLLRPAADVADRGFVVDATFRSQVAANAAPFAQFPATAALYLPGGAPPAVGSTLRNPDLADTYRLIGRRGVDVFYRGSVAADIVRTVQRPPAAPTPAWAHPIRPGGLTVGDLARYRVRYPAPTRSSYRGMDVYGMSAPSSGGTAVGEALNIIEKSGGPVLHRYLEASALAFADRNRYVGDDTPRSVLRELLSEGFATERACRVSPTAALPKPVPPGTPDGRYAGCPAATSGALAPGRGMSTTNLTVADRWGNVVEYTFTIEQTGGNAMVVPGRGFLLNNELTDFNFTGTQGAARDPNLPGPGKRPRSSIAPTIILRDGRPVLALGSPGGATIITTVLQLLVNRYELGMSLPEAVAAPRASQRNAAQIETEAAFRARHGPELAAFGHAFRPADTAEIGAATAIEFKRGGAMLAVAEPARRGGGAAAVVAPAPRR